MPGLALKGMASHCKKFELPRPKGTSCHRHTMAEATVRRNACARVPQFLLSSVSGHEDTGDTLYAPYSTHFQLQVSDLCLSSLPLSQGQLSFGNGVCHHFSGTKWPSRTDDLPSFLHCAFWGWGGTWAQGGSSDRDLSRWSLGADGGGHGRVNHVIASFTGSDS